MRARLRDYNPEESKRDTIVIELPKGGYVPRLIERCRRTKSVDALVPATRHPGKAPTIKTRPSDSSVALCMRRGELILPVAEKAAVDGS